MIFTNIVFFIFLAFFLGVACKAGPGSTSSAVLIYAHGSGGEQGIGVRPLVFLHGRENNEVCRRGKPNAEIYRFEGNCFNLRREGETNTDSSSNTEGGTTANTTRSNSSNTNTGNQQTTNNNQGESNNDENNTPISVSANWFKVGFSIGNTSKTDWLIITDISFTITGRWGSQTLQNQTSIGSGYCETDPLYIIKPVQSNATSTDGSIPTYLRYYEPAKAKYENNMTIYISGVPIPDGPPQFGGGDGGGSAGSPGPASGQSGGADGGEEGNTTPATSSNNDEPFILDRLPNYRVTALFTGYWIDKKCNSVSNFNKTHQFYLSSSFQN